MIGRLATVTALALALSLALAACGRVGELQPATGASLLFAFYGAV